MRLLLVEDNNRLAEFMRDGLYKAGFELDHVADAQDAEATLDAQGGFDQHVSSSPSCGSSPW